MAMSISLHVRSRVSSLVGNTIRKLLKLNTKYEFLQIFQNSTLSKTNYTPAVCKQRVF